MTLFEKKHFKDGFPARVRCVLCKKDKIFKSFFKVSRDCTGMDKKKPFLENFLYGPPKGLCLSCSNGKKVYLLFNQSHSMGIFETPELAFQEMEHAIKLCVKKYASKKTPKVKREIEDYQRLHYTVQPILVNQPLAVIPNKDSFLSAEQHALHFPTVAHPIAVYRCLGCGHPIREKDTTLYEAKYGLAWFCKDSSDCESSAKLRYPPEVLDDQNH